MYIIESVDSDRERKVGWNKLMLEKVGYLVRKLQERQPLSIKYT